MFERLVKNQMNDFGLVLTLVFNKFLCWKLQLRTCRNAIISSRNFHLKSVRRVRTDLSPSSGTITENVFFWHLNDSQYAGVVVARHTDYILHTTSSPSSPHAHSRVVRQNVSDLRSYEHATRQSLQNPVILAKNHTEFGRLTHAMFGTLTTAFGHGLLSVDGCGVSRTVFQTIETSTSNTLCIADFSFF